LPIRSFNNYIEANIILNMLQDAGINCHLEDENTITIVNLSTGMRLMVYHTQVERAMEILKDTEDRFLKSVACPTCGHHSLEIKMVTVDLKPQLGRLLSLLSNWFSKEGTMVELKNYYCNNCGAHFEDIPVPTD
jgi:DNA-directed RNA polymerase subunit RPC12/RpoP